MMKLRNMLRGMAGDAVAAKFAELWTHDEDSLSFWRASSNFVYEMRRGGERYFLRFVLEEDRDPGQIEAELDYVEYLAKQGYPCAVPVTSLRGRRMETAETDEGAYHGVLFTYAAGVRPVLAAMTGEQMHQWGRSLASMHLLARSYAPAGAGRRSWQDILAWTESELLGRAGEEAAIAELRRLGTWLESLPDGCEAAGLIHYDFQPDNVFWDEERRRFTAIDFDDAMIHWYAMDIAAALADLIDDEVSGAPEKIDTFTAGYRTLMPLDDETIHLLPDFRKFDRLYGYVRILRSLDGSDVADPPAWYRSLRSKLNRIIETRRAEFTVLR